MDRVDVESKNVVSAGYDAENSILEIEYSDGGIYQYTNVPQTKYEELISTDSVGRFLIQSIKGVHPFTRRN